MKIFIRTTRAVTQTHETSISLQSLFKSSNLSLEEKLLRHRVKNFQKRVSLLSLLLSLLFSKTSSSKTSKRACASYYHIIIIIIRRERERESESERESQRESERKTERKTERKRENAAEEIGRKIICWRKKTREKRERSGEERAGEIDDDDDFGVEKGEDYGKECEEKEGE